MPSPSERLYSVFTHIMPCSSLATKTLFAIGTLWSLGRAFLLFRFCHLWFFRSSSLKRYVSEDSWALVTGASDGIGKGFAEELCFRGVNVVLHGRNEQKLQKVRSELLDKWPSRKIRLLVLDAADIANLTIKSVEDLNIRILVNNVGGNGSAKPLWAPLVERSSSDVGQFLDINARFPTELTRLLLPKLMSNQPSLIINIGSGSCDFACPYIEMFNAAKAYNQIWSKSLRLEMEAERQDIEVLHFQIGMVQSNSAQRATSFLIPSSRKLAECGLGMVGCGREVVWPYWPHAVQFGLIASLPMWLRNRVILSMALKEKALEQRGES